MKQPQTILIAFIAICLIACKVIPMKDEQAFAEKISSSLNGLPVTVSAAIGTSTEEGNYRRLEVEIDNYTASDENPDYQLTYATSIPAVLYSKDSALLKKKYNKILVTVKNGTNELEVFYTPKDLENVERCTDAYNGFTEGLRTLDKQILQRYSDAALWESASIDSVIASLKVMDEKYGQSTASIFGGFKKDDKGKSFSFPLILERPKINHRVVIAIDPLIKKVIYFKI